MKKSLRPKMRPARLEKMMPGDELSTSETTETIKVMRPKMRPADMEERGAVERGNRSSMYEAMDMETQKYAGGGMVRGCKGVQTSGKGFRGSY